MELIDKFLIDNPKYILFESPIDPGDYKCLSWMFGEFKEDYLYCDAYHWYYIENGISMTEKVSHYVPNQPERSKREDS